MKNEKSIWKGFCCIALLPVAFALLIANVPINATPTDDIIVSAAKESYIFKNYLQDDNIVVESKDGIVTLTGSVSEESHKALAQEIVESIVGVVVVDNHLQIKSEIAKSSDTVIFSRVRLAIMSHRSLRGIDVRFIVENGNVTITGSAINTAQIDLTTAYIKDVEGVKDVKNEMGVINEQPEVGKTLGEKVGDAGKKIGDKIDVVGKKIGDKTSDVAELIDDGSITAMVKAALMYHRSTSALGTKVGTQDGVVTLSGTAKNESARELATKVAQDVRGVRSVVNTMGLEIAQ
ncbi:MAG: BON domain-containing protein [Proteobacteria bacterium]|nr:BON domain-containing protein [Pseudomonadota bacterium]